jgi:hypothetical protein
MDLLGWSAIATIVAVPLIVIGWFVTTSKTTNKARTSSGTATAGDVTARGGLAIGHNAQVVVHTPPDTSLLKLSTRKRLPPDISKRATAIFSREFKKSGKKHG